MLSQSLWRRILFFPPITSAASPSGTRTSRRSLVPAVTLQPRRPEGCTRLQGQSQDPTSGDQTSASHPRGGKDPPSALPSSLRPKLLNPVGARAGASLLPMDGLRSGRDRLPRQTPRGSRFSPLVTSFGAQYGTFGKAIPLAALWDEAPGRQLRRRSSHRSRPRKLRFHTVGAAEPNPTGARGRVR